MKLLILILFLIMIILIIKFNSIYFINKNELKTIINKSEFFNNMNKKDLKIRNVKNKEDYKKLYYESFKNFNFMEKINLWFIILKINILTFNYKNYRNIKWKFVKIDKNIENGFPHTLEDVIVLSNIPNNIDTLIHEKFHIYQRKYHKNIIILFNKLGFIEYNKTNIPIFILENKRNNPDIEKHYLKDDRFLYIQLYNENPKNLTDSKPYKYDIKNKKIYYNDDNNTNQKENPNEITAELLSKLIRKKTENKIIEEWIKIYL